MHEFLTGLVHALQAATDLDAVIAAHDQYLETLLKKALLDDNVSDRPGAVAQNGLQGHLHNILRLNEIVSPDFEVTACMCSNIGILTAASEPAFNVAEPSKRAMHASATVQSCQQIAQPLCVMSMP